MGLFPELKMKIKRMLYTVLFLLVGVGVAGSMFVVWSPQVGAPAKGQRLERIKKITQFQRRSVFEPGAHNHGTPTVFGADGNDEGKQKPNSGPSASNLAHRQGRLRSQFTPKLAGYLAGPFVGIVTNRWHQHAHRSSF